MDYEFKPFNPSKFDYDAHNSEETFERTCIRTLNRVWLPSFSFSQLERQFLMDQPDSVLNYDWYRQHIYFENMSAPDLTFCRYKKAWSLDLYTLLKSNIKKTELYKKWEEQPSAGFVFPLIGSQAIIYESCSPPDFNCVIQGKGDSYIIIALLKDYAALYKEAKFNV